VSPGTVLRELTLLSAVFEVARREWRWLDANPVKIIRKPSKPAHRERLITWREIKAQLRALDHHPGAPAKSVTQAIALCFLAALRTGMRAGELATLSWRNFHGHYAKLVMTKNGSAREVPLSLKARSIFDRARGFDPVLCFGVSSQSLDTLFRQARDRAGLKGFTFHDARHVAATWICRSGRLEMLEMCKMFGWKDPKHALSYFSPTVKDLASKLG
jgi:integrase